MSVLVTGGAGYIGSHMVWELLDHGESVVVLDRLSTGFAWAVAPEAVLFEGDVADRALVARLVREHRVDAVIHFAGSAVVPDSLADPLGYYGNNTCRTLALLEACVEAGVAHFVFSSTAAVYGGARLEPVREDAGLMPESPYGRSKLMSEWMLRDAAAAFGFTYTALRYFNVAGADRRGRAGQSTRGATHLIKAACEASLAKRPSLSVFGTDYPTPDGTCLRDFIHVGDLVAAHRLALDRLRRGGDSLIANCGYGRGISVLEVLDSVRRVGRRDFPVQFAPRRAGDAAAVIADSALARRELAWAPSMDDLDSIIEGALAWEASLSRKNSAA